MVSSMVTTPYLCLAQTYTLNQQMEFANRSYKVGLKYQYNYSNLMSTHGRLMTDPTKNLRNYICTKQHTTFLAWFFL